jgi:hypothetical protein
VEASMWDMTGVCRHANDAHFKVESQFLKDFLQNKSSICNYLSKFLFLSFQSISLLHKNNLYIDIVMSFNYPLHSILSTISFLDLS